MVDELIEYYDRPILQQPILVVALEGWIDAGAAAATAMGALLEATDATTIARFDTDELLDHRARRPLMRLEDGLMGELAWPSIELRAATDTTGRHVLFLVGAEPDHLWGAFTATVMEAAAELDVRMVVGLGAYPAATPHTRSTQLSITSPSAELLASFPGFVRGSVEVPAGVAASIEMAAYEQSISAVGLWAQVPHYVSGMSYPAASLALIEGITRVSGYTFEAGDLASQAMATRTRLDELVGDNPQYVSMLQQLEELADSSAASPELGALPTGDELAAELQQFLREQGTD
jgi:hypothetical protein